MVEKNLQEVHGESDDEVKDLHAGYHSDGMVESSGSPW